MAKKLDCHVKTIERYLENTKYRNLLSDVGKTPGPSQRETYSISNDVYWEKLRIYS